MSATALSVTATGVGCIALLGFFFILFVLRSQVTLAEKVVALTLSCMVLAGSILILCIELSKR